MRDGVFAAVAQARHFIELALQAIRLCGQLVGVRQSSGALIVKLSRDCRKLRVELFFFAVECVNALIQCINGCLRLLNGHFKLSGFCAQRGKCGLVCLLFAAKRFLKLVSFRRECFNLSFEFGDCGIVGRDGSTCGIELGACFILLLLQCVALRGCLLKLCRKSGLGLNGIVTFCRDIV